MPAISVITGNALDLNLLDICLRLACAMAVGLIIGTEREYTHRPAGMRTHILVALGACVVTITGQLIFAQYAAYNATPDPARLSAQVITGVGFLGAGTIMREGTSVKGLTTAASVWAVACLGIASGFGYYWVALTGMVFIFITLTIFEAIQDKLMGGQVPLQHYQAECTDIAAALQAIQTHADDTHTQTRNVLAVHLDENLYRVSFQLEANGIRSKKRQQQFFERLAKEPAFTAVQRLDDPVSAGK